MSGFSAAGWAWLNGWLALIHGRSALLLLACLLSLVFGGPASLHRLLGLDRPGRAWRSLLETLGRKLNRPGRVRRDRAIRGLILSFLVLGVAWSITHLIGDTNRPDHWSRTDPSNSLARWFFLIEAGALAVILPFRPVSATAGSIAAALRKHDPESVRALSARLGRRDPETLDLHAMARSAVESLAERFSSSLVAVSFWYLIGGLGAAFAVAAISQLERLFGARDRDRNAFGGASARFDDLFQFIPSRLSVLLLTVAAPFLPGGHPGQALVAATTGGTRFGAPNPGRPIAAMAGALGVTLGGPRRVTGKTVNDPWCGEGSARLGPTDIRRAQLLYALSSGWLMIIIAIVYLVD